MMVLVHKRQSIQPFLRHKHHNRAAPVPVTSMISTLKSMVVGLDVPNNEPVTFMDEGVPFSDDEKREMSMMMLAKLQKQNSDEKLMQQLLYQNAELCSAIWGRAMHRPMINENPWQQQQQNAPRFTQQPIIGFHNPRGR